jgi:superfamily II DNA or RNA helicase
MLKLRPYQENVLSKLSEKFESGIKEVVIAACPSSGKTVMMLEYIRRNIDKKFLVLTHGQNVLRDMWANEIADHLGDTAQITFGIPQALKNTDLKGVDTIIIDEAHEFTFASMVVEIKKRVKAKNIIYLTGTPSKFIRLDMDVIIVPASELIENDYISDLYIGLFSTSVPLKDTDYNQQLNTKNVGDSKLVKSVNTDLDSLLDVMTNRLRQTKFFKSEPVVSNRTAWMPNLEQLQKTMIACNSIKQAAKVVKYFESKGVNVISSNSENDKNSENILKFQSDSSILVLVVVDRAILGFNMPQLVNVVDMTCSHNIDRIYQLYARVMRKNEDQEKKYFFKMTSDNDMVVTKFYMSAALMMLTYDFISKFNGKNLNAMQVPEIKLKNGKRASKGKSRKPMKRKVIIDEAFYNEVSSYKVLVDIMNKCGDSANEYAYTTFGKLKSEVFGSIRPIVNITEENLLYMIRTGEVDERIYE